MNCVIYFFSKEYHQIEWKLREDLIKLIKNDLIMKDLMRQMHSTSVFTLSKRM